jgi:Na+-transporting NADH:ubiquinone oxidoreductase subunit C
MSLNKDSVLGTITVAAVLCIVCSVLVSSAAVLLRDAQEANKSLDRKLNIVSVAGLLEEGQDVEAAFSKIQTRVIEFETGDDVGTDVVDPKTFDPREAEKDPKRSVRIPAEKDFGNIKRRAIHGLVYEARENGELRCVVLPVHGKGLWGTMYGLLALESDLRTVRGFKFYEHVETPGLGGEVDNPRWRDQWPGKKLYDASGAIAIEVMKGQVVQNRPETVHQVDGLSGATITSRSVSSLIQYWLSDDGYGRFLAKLSARGGQNGQR